jgi:hypothetical protein
MRASRKTPATRASRRQGRPKNPEGKFERMSTVLLTGPKMDPEAQSLWHEVATASDEVAEIVDRIPGLTVAGVETRNELERAAALLKAVAGILRRTERREGARYAPVNRSILGPDPVS